MTCISFLIGCGRIADCCVKVIVIEFIFLCQPASANNSESVVFTGRQTFNKAFDELFA
jgi:hypothetical protein